MLALQRKLDWMIMHEYTLEAVLANIAWHRKYDFLWAFHGIALIWTLLFVGACQKIVVSRGVGEVTVALVSSYTHTMLQERWFKYILCCCTA